MTEYKIEVRDMEFNFPHPMRLAVGSHAAGSGRGCAMNVISYENGDTEITDYPACSAKPLARLVQSVNDNLCTHRDGDFLCPACSVTVLELGHATVGTGDFSQVTLRLWLRALLERIAPDAGGARAAVLGVAELLGEREPDRDALRSARKVARAYAAADAAYAADADAADAAYAAADADAADADAYAAYAADAACAAYAARVGGDRVEFTRCAIAEWHRIAGTQAPAAEPARTLAAVEQMVQVRS
ncbi:MULTISPECIES: hypothetical protein [Pseudonocardia]|uniref:Uncharacterized protein n=2 Tax=Pseudonocardia TaxID=1847 RepID=A0A1Y2MLF7_PSEAH|nr:MULTISPECIES: hypothetical protein [Pseudonocardia]OSY36105.1 hypothetical protein BG845_05620 [Pseudonocardia autotrophica]TDN77587.1 hypothetical protein C8E95_6836 [Pseudonocardia autotrophica]BBG01617.1 hypothetical protein Pdca_28260 [Pseudonocardia autotrophica]GEC25362.1 hypothetical protein PSA01_23910 [Pseudonocardia saturnea]